MNTTVPLGPWPLGIDNVHSPSHRVFQLPGQGQPPARLRGAMDVDLDDEGWVQSRFGVALAGNAIEDGERIFSVDGVLFTQAGGTLTWGEDGLVEDLAGPVLAHVWPSGSDRVWATDGVTCFQIRGGVLKPWGLAVPMPAIEALEEGQTGTLRAGTYLVATTLRDGLLNNPTAQESGAKPPIEVELAAPGGFTITQVVTDPNATHVVFYVSAVNGSEPLVVSVEAIVEDAGHPVVRSASLTLTDPDQIGTTRIPLLTLGASPPPTGITALGSLQAFMLAAKGNALYRSRPGQPWLFDKGSAIQMFSTPITTIIGLQTGAWVGTEGGLYWMAGDRPETWVRLNRHHSEVLPHGALISGSAIPALQTADPIALFATREGFIAGLPDGSVRPLTQDRYHFPEATAVRIVYLEGARRFFVAIQEN